MTVAEKWHLRADSQVGEGTFGRVYRATRVATAQVVALKKSRASLALKSTLLNHERLLLQRLEGHPSIPKVFAYGRLKHFEYLAMEFLGVALDDVQKHCWCLPMDNVLLVADQMVSALEHLHKSGIVHCDLKPGNILLHPTDPKRLYLVDYGFGRVIAPTTQASSTNMPSYHVIGTLLYASLNMHYGIRPAPRDDIESLGYSLLHLARGYLPWTYNVRHGTRKTQHDQVRIKKQRYTGADLASNGLPFIGEMIDYARSLMFDQLPDYKLLRSQIQETRRRAGARHFYSVKWNIPHKTSDDLLLCPIPNDPIFPLRPGQIVCCQADVRTTLEGYSARAGDPSFWRDSSLSPERWNTVVRPAVVLNVEIDKRTKLWSVHVACIGRGALSSTSPNVVPISPLPTKGSVTPNPTWPLSDCYCYIFPRPMKFLCYPGEIQSVSSTWTLSTVDIDHLRKKFDNDAFARTLTSSETYRPYEDVFVKVTAFGADVKHSDAMGQPIEWGGCKAWFEEHVDLILRRRENERGTMEKPMNGDAPSDSYWEWDFERWGHCQPELDSSLAAGVDGATAFANLPLLPVIVDVEVSDDVRYQASLT